MGGVRGHLSFQKLEPGTRAIGHFHSFYPLLSVSDAFCLLKQSGFVYMASCHSQPWTSQKARPHCTNQSSSMITMQQGKVQNVSECWTDHPICPLQSHLQLGGLKTYIT